MLYKVLMSNKYEASAGIAEDIVTNMSAIAQLDGALTLVNSRGTPEMELRHTVVSDLETAVQDISTANLTKDRLDLLSAVAADQLGNTSAALVVRNALTSAITTRRDQYRARQHALGKMIRGNQYFAVTPLVDDIVRRSRGLTTLPPPEPIYRDYTLYMRTFRNRSIDVFTVWPKLRSSRVPKQPYESGHNFNGYSMLGVAQRSIGIRMCDVSLVDLAGNPLVSIVPLSDNPKDVPAPRHQLI
ncbi:MAG: hypothetical protein JWN82_619 [Candidatus Saccharibacteria bacterium]|nr:hypothetical protein [Candidatus Saccharibacteria bacterium]